MGISIQPTSGPFRRSENGQPTVGPQPESDPDPSLRFASPRWLSFGAMDAERAREARVPLATSGAAEPVQAAPRAYGCSVTSCPTSVTPFLVGRCWEGSPAKMDHREKVGTHILTSLLEDLGELKRLPWTKGTCGFHLAEINICFTVGFVGNRFHYGSCFFPEGLKQMEVGLSKTTLSFIGFVTLVW